MEIRSVRLINVRKHINRIFEFAPGVNLLYGLNGAGKSSVIEAISFAIFGHLTTTPRASMITDGKTLATIDVVFEHNGQRWYVERGIGEASKFNVFTDGGDGWEQVAQGHGQSMAKIHEALGIPDNIDLSRIARDALIPPQGELATGFNLPETGRIDYFTPVLNLDKYRRAWRELLSPLSKIGNELHTAVGRMSGLVQSSGGLSLDQAQEQLETVGLQILEAQREQTLLDQQVSDLTEQLGALQEQWKGAEEKRVQLADYQRRMVSLDLRIKGFEAFLPELEELPRLQQERSGIVLDKELTERYQSASIGQANFEARMDRLNDQIERLRQDYQLAKSRAREAEEARGLLPDAEFSLKAVEVKLQRAGEEHALASNEHARHDEAIGLLEPGQPCPVCGAPLTEETAKKRKRELESAMAVAFKRMLGANKHLDELPDKIAVLRAKVQDYQSRIAQDCAVDTIAEQCAEAEHEALEAAKQLEQQKAVVSELWTEVQQQKVAEALCAELDKQIQALLMKQVQVRDLDDLRNELASMKTRINLLKAELSNAPTLIDVNEKIRERGCVQEDLEEKETSLSALKLEQANLERVIEIIKEAKEAQKEVDQLQDAQGLLGRCRQAVSDIGPRVANQVMMQLGALAGQYWKAMGKTGNLGWDGSFLVTIDGLDYRQLSGGEKVIAALACRLAIARYRADLGFMILDEPTIHLDQVSKQGLVEVVAGLGLGQIIIVSHDDAFTAAATNVIGV